MTPLSSVLGLALGALFAASCAAPAADVEARLPKTIGGLEIEYNRTTKAGLERGSPAEALADALAKNPASVTFISGHRDPQGNYDSDVFQVPGANTDDLMEAMIATYRFIGPRRIDVIAGKSVVRATPEPSGAVGETPDFDSAPYFYAFDDVVVVILGRPDYVKEGLAAMP